MKLISQELIDAGVIQRWPTRYGTAIERLCALADAMLERIGDAMRAADASPRSPAPATARAKRAARLNVELDELNVHEIPGSASTFRKLLVGGRTVGGRYIVDARTVVVEVVGEDDDGIDGFEIFVLASETNRVDATFANVKRIAGGLTVDDLLRTHDQVAEAAKKIDAMILELVSEGSILGRAAGALRKRIADALNVEGPGA